MHFRRDLGRQLLLMADTFAFLQAALCDDSADARRFDLLAEMFYDEAARLSEIGKVVCLAAGQPF